MVFESLGKHGGHEEVVYCHDKVSGLKAIIAVHNTTLGPALGGTRMWSYKTEEDALIDVLRLSEGMTYKAAAAGLNLGGGKAVIIGNPRTDKTEGMFRAFGQYVNSLNGRYITAEDVGTTVNDMEYVYMETPWVTGIPKSLGGSGDPSPYTAHGVLMAIRASAKQKLGADSLNGVRIAVQGLGNVGSHLVKYLKEEGAELTITDIDEIRTKTLAEQYGAATVAPDDITKTDCDIFAPCAMGAVINDQSLEELRCKVVSGGANNQLAEPRHGTALKEMGILYAPDFVANAGGLMNVFVELEGYSVERALEKTTRIFDNMLEIFETAKQEDITTNDAALRVAKKRIDILGRVKQKHWGKTSRPFTSLKEVFQR